MASLLVALAWLAALVLAAVKLTGTIGGSFTSWCGWLALVIVCVLGCLSELAAYRTRP